jgi:type IV pilus assembly protein PilQ
MVSMMNTLKLRFLTALITLGLLTAQQVYAETNAVSNVEFSTQGQGNLVVRIGLNHKLSALPASFTVNQPPRIALDLQNTSNGIGKNLVEVNQAMLRSINVVQAGDRTRLVLNLLRPAQYDSQIDGNYLLITLRENGTAGVSNMNTHFANSAPVAGGHTIRNVDFRRGASGEAKVIATLADSSTGIDINRVGDSLQVKFIKTGLPANLRRRLDVTDFGTPVTFIDTKDQGENVVMNIHPKGEYDYSAYQTDNKFIVEIRQKSDTQLASAAKGVYTGEKLSLNFQNTDVRAVLQVIADFTGKNIITSDTVTGNLTLLLKDVPWDQALDIILESKGLDKRQIGDVIWVAPKDELLAKEKSELEAEQSIQNLEPLVVRQYQLNYKKADSASRELLGLPALPGDTGEGVTCEAQAQGITATTAAPIAAAPVSGAGAASNPNRILSSRGTATSEMQTNTLIVSDTLSKQDQVAQMLKLIDTPARQVMIEARVVVANDSFSKALGAKLGVNFANSSTAVYGNANNVNSGGMLTPAAIGSATAPNYAVNLPAPAVAGNAAALGFSLFNLGSGALLNLELQAMETDNVGKIISSPRVITTNQMPAVILQGTQIPNVTPGTATSPPTITFSDAFLCLLVNPQILNNDSVILTIEVQDDAEGPQFSSGGVIATPIDTKRVKTRVRMRDGETVVLGGIFTQDKRNVQDKVPFLGNIPVLGALFRDNSETNNKTELMVFITPHIVKDDMTLR